MATLTNVISNATGNVGIGTTSPAYKLDVNGSVNLTGNINFTGTGEFYLQNAASTNFIGINTTSNYIRFATNNSIKVFIDSAGNLGIGTSSPADKLDVNGAVYIRGSNSLKLDNASNNYVTQIYNDGSSGTSTLVFNTGGSEKMRIINGGNVGIGTTSPKLKLDIAGAGAGSIALTNTGTTGYSEVIFYEGSNVKGDIWVNGSAQSNYAGANSFNILQNSNAPIAFYTNGNNERMRIDGGGNVGIGTTSPTQRLDLSGSLRIRSAGTYSDPTDNAGFINYDSIGGIFTLSARSNSGNTYMAFRTSNAGTAGEKMRIINDGNVGIGTTSPAYKLDVTGDVYGSNYYSVLTAASYGPSDASATMQVFGSTGSGGLTNTIKFVTGGNERVRITSGGYVGIGTSTTTSGLQIQTEGTNTTSGSFLFVNSIGASFGGGAIGVGYQYAAPVGNNFYPFRIRAGSTNAIFTINSTGVVYAGDTTGAVIYGNHDPYYSFNQDTNTGMDWAAADTLTFKTGGSEKVRIDSSGNVGIGTTSPTGTYGKLSVAGGIRILDDNNAKLEIGRYSSGASNSYIKLGSNSNSLRITNNTDAADIFTIENGGNVGIGTTSPKNKLHIAGLMTLDSTIIYSKVNNVTTNNPIRITIPFTKVGTGGDFIVKVKAVAMADNSSGVNYLDYVGYSGYTFNFNTNLTTIEKLGNVVVNSYVSASSATAGNLYIELNGDDGYLQDSNWTIQTDVMGNSRYATFDSGSITTFATSISEDSLETSFNKYFGGNVGIGTTSFVYSNAARGDIEVYGSTDALISLRNATANSYLQKSGNDFYFNNGGAGFISITTNASERMRITSDGNVGIGTSSPTSLLTVGSTTTTTSAMTLQGEYQSSTFNNTNIFNFRHGGFDRWRLLTTQNSAASNDFDFSINAINAAVNGYNTYVTVKGLTGNVGIGTTSPNYKLHLSGSMFISGTGTKFSGPAYEDGYRLKFYDNGGVTNDPGIGLDGAGLGSELMWFNALSGFYWYVGTSGEKMRLNSSGNLGIGTTVPNEKLSIYPGTTGGIALQDSGGTTRSYFFIDNTNPTYSTGIRTTNYYLDFDSSGGAQNAIRFYTGTGGIGTGTERMRITGGGYVGIGTSTTTSGLQIQTEGTNTTSGSFLFVRSTNASFGGGAIGVGYQYAAAVGNNFTPFRIRAGTTNAIFTINSSGVVYAGDTTGAVIYGNHDPYYSFNQDTNTGMDWAASDTLTFKTGGAERMRLDSTGGINIGTSSQLNSSRVSIADSALKTSAGNCLTFATATGGSNDFQLIINRGSNTSGYYAFQAVEQGVGYKNIVFNQNGGYLGIGTTSPSNKTTIEADATGVSFADNDVGQLVIRGATNTAKRLGLGIDTTNNIGVIQAQLYGTGQYPLVLNPAGGNVGIGTTTAAYKLDVGGTARVGDVFLVTTATTSDARIEVGSGRSGNGNSYVDLVGDATYTDYGLRLIRSNGGANTTSAIAHRGTGTLYITAVDAAAISLETTNTTRMTIAPGGNVGIGTTSPSATLTVIASNNTGSRIQLGTVSTSTFMDVNKVNDFIVLTAPYGSTPASVSNGGAKWGIKMNGSIDNINIKSKTAAIYAVSEEDSGGGAGYNRKVGLALHTSGFDLDNAERLRINSSGNVGIGTTSVSADLVVGYNGTVHYEEAGATNVLIKGKTSNARALLEIHDSAGLVKSYFQSVYSAGLAYIGTLSAHSLVWTTSGTEKVRLDTSGNLLIGTTTSPSNAGISLGATGTVRQLLGGMENTSWRIRERDQIDALAITTNINDAGTQDSSARSSWKLRMGWGNGFDNFVIARSPVASNSFSDLFYIKSDGNVGIGTTGPTARLHIRGGTELLNTSGSTSGTTSGSLMIVGQNTKGGANYHDFLYIKNSKATLNPNKFFRQDNTGNFEIINSNYGTNIFTLTDSGSLSLPVAQSRNVTQLRNTGAGLKVGNFGLFFDDGNVHLHSTSPGTNLWLNCSGSGMLVVNGQTGATNGMCVGTSTQSGFVTIVGSKSVSIAQPYGYLISSGAGSTTGTSPNPYSLTCDSRIMSSEFNAPSDERLKNIRGEISLDKAIDFVTKVDPIEFTWKDGVDTGLKAGYSAQQTYKAGFEHLIGVVPKQGISEVVESDGFVSPKDAQFVMNYEQVTPYHSKLIKHLLDKVEKLEKELENLKNRL